jgi:type IV pilus assembly protein PilV
MKIMPLQLRGLSLIEVLVTIAITSIGLMGLLSLQMQSLRATSDTGNRGQAQMVLNDLQNRIHANKDASSNYVTSGSNVCIPKIGAAAAKVLSIPTKKCASYHTGSTLVPSAIDCTGAELAEWDLYEISCGSPKADDFQGNAIAYLPSAQITITCTVLPCVDGKALNLSLEWRARVDNETITGAARTANSGLLSLTHPGFTP